MPSGPTSTGSPSTYGRPFRVRGRRLDPWTVLFLATMPLILGCASSAPEREPISDPAAVAADARENVARRGPAEVRFRWDYADERGPLRGDGVARYNPPDSLRLDLFTAGDNSMSIALADGELSSLGSIEDLRLPTPPFLYATAGIFRPAGERPARGYETSAGTVLVFENGDHLRRYGFDGENRLREIEQVREGRVTRRLTVEWPGTGAWPAGAEYRDLTEDRRVRWEMTGATPVDTRFPAGIFALPRRR